MMPLLLQEEEVVFDRRGSGAVSILAIQNEGNQEVPWRNGLGVSGC